MVDVLRDRLRSGVEYQVEGWEERCQISATHSVTSSVVV